MIVADASVIANALADFGTSGATARARLRRESVAVPDLAYVETLSVLRKHSHRGGISGAELRRAVDVLAAAPFESYSTVVLLGRAYELRNNVSAYDAMYLALAEGLGCPLITGDSRLASVPGARCAVEVLVD